MDYEALLEIATQAMVLARKANNGVGDTHAAAAMAGPVAAAIVAAAVADRSPAAIRQALGCKN